MRAWLLDKRRAPDVERALQHRPSAELEASIRPKVEASRGEGPGVLVIAGTEAEISVNGVLTETFDWWLEYSCGGCTAYEDIRAAIAQAEADPNVKRIIFAVSSPGGEADGLHVTVQTIEAMQKPTLTRATCALSAAYAIAAATGRIEAISDASEFGCLGVAMEFGFWADREIVTVTNTESPDKRPDPRTADGKKAITAYLDAIYGWYADGIARGREVTLDKVNADFGRGAVLMAPDAKKRGMVDGFAAQRSKGGRAGASAFGQLALDVDGALRASGTIAGVELDAVSYDGGKTWTTAPFETNPEPGAPATDPVTGTENPMNKKLIAQALGLSESATDEEIEAKVVAQGAAFKTSTAALAALTALTGKDAEESVGVLLAWKQSHEAAPELTGKLATATAKITKLEQSSELDALIKVAKEANKLTPAEETALRQTFAENDITLKGVKAHLEAKAAHPALAATSENKTAPAAETAAPVVVLLKHNGKSWAEMKPAERAALKKADLETYNAMRDQALKVA